MGSLIGAALLATSTIFLPSALPTTTPQTSPQAGIEAMITFVANEYNVSPITLHNLAQSESNLDPNAVGDHGCSLGIVQINTCAHPISKTDALDPLYSLNFAARAIANGTDDIFTSCNCYSLVESKLGTLPLMGQIVPNIGKPNVGDVAIFYYPSIETGRLVKHIAYVSSVGQSSFTIEESNKTHCLIDSRVILNSYYLAGFWSPTT